jgi:hypothetical protein
VANLGPVSQSIAESAYILNGLGASVLKQGLISSATSDQQWQRERPDIAKPDY